jgi:CheY-like chemotaxis protein
VAPELNNLLTVITGQAHLLLESAETAGSIRESLLQIYSSGEKAANLIRQLMLFSGRQHLCAQILKINVLIEETRPVLDSLLGSNIALELRLAPSLPGISADAAMLEHILISLALNAREAMPHGGSLIIATSVITFSDIDPSIFPGGRPGSFVILEVTDTGCGIPPDVLPHIFEPFFTTKSEGRGHGLGLSTIFGIVQQHQGWVNVVSAVGTGTKIQVFLPIASSADLAQLPTRINVQGESGHEAILLVEDDIPVREFTAALLQNSGYRVLQAGSISDALEVWKWHGSRIELLLTDMVLDGQMTGLDLANKLRAEKSGLGVICTSGHSREILEGAPKIPDGCHFLSKPWRPQELNRLIRTVLDSEDLKTRAGPCQATDKVPLR